MSKWISDDDWATIVANVPIVSVDLLVQYDDGLVLGRRTNEPAKGFWFMPGGRVQKGETRSEAVYRIGKEELGVDLKFVESLVLCQPSINECRMGNGGWLGLLL